MTIDQLYKLFINYPSICIDSRRIEQNCLFFALKGDNFNGNEFAINALKSGAQYAIVDDTNLKNEEKCIYVDDVLKTLQNLATYHRQQLKIPIIAITGTNGKTTTKELIAIVLSIKYKTIATKGNLNNHIGVPLTLLSLKNETEIGVIEMGANHMGEIEMLCGIADPDFGIITNIGKAHLEGFGSFQGVIQAKTEMYKYINSKKGTIFYNADNSLLVDEIEKLNCKKMDYGTSANHVCRGRLLDSEHFLKFETEIKNSKGEIIKKIVQTNLVGIYNLENALAAVTIGNFFDIPINDIEEAIRNYIPSNNRSQFLKTEKNELIIDYYNANPTSMEAAIKNFHSLHLTLNDKTLILGEMLELGNYSIDEHSKIISLINELGFKNVLLVGTEFNLPNSKNFKLFDNSIELAEFIIKNKISGNQILIKGSRGVKLEKILEYL